MYPRGTSGATPCCDSCCAALPALQLIQGKLADMYTTTQATRSFIYATAAAADAGWALAASCNSDRAFGRSCRAEPAQSAAVCVCSCLLSAHAGVEKCAHFAC